MGFKMRTIQESVERLMSILQVRFESRSKNLKVLKVSEGSQQNCVAQRS